MHQWKETFMELIDLPMIKIRDERIIRVKYKNESGKVCRPLNLIHYAPKNGVIEKYHYRGDYCIDCCTVWFYHSGKVSRRYYSFTCDGILLEILIGYYKNGNIKTVEYFNDGNRHKIGSPAYITWYKNGNISCEIYCINGVVHRTNGPSIIYYYENGDVQHEFDFFYVIY